MSNAPRFLIARNPLAEPGVDYIVHTQSPVLIVRVEQLPDGYDFSTVYAEPTDMTPERLAALGRRMGDWYTALKAHENKSR